MDRFLSLSAIMLICVLASSSGAQDIPEFRARVEVSVIAADDNIRKIVEGHVKGELEALKDVEIIDYEPEWKLQIKTMDLLTKGGDKSGVLLSVIILNRFNNHRLSYFMPASSRKKPDKIEEPIPYYYADNWLKTGSVEDLKKLCDEIVVEFDRRYLEENRKTHRQLMYMWRKTMRPGDNRP